MKSKYLLILFLTHWGLSLIGFMGISAWAIAVQDAGPATETVAQPGSPAVDIRWFEMPLRYGLLQPLAHWVLQAVAIDWWVWIGLLQLAALFAVNSLIVASLVAVGSRHVRAWRSCT